MTGAGQPGGLLWGLEPWRNSHLNLVLEGAALQVLLSPRKQRDLSVLMAALEQRVREQIKAERNREQLESLGRGGRERFCTFAADVQLFMRQGYQPFHLQHWRNLASMPSSEGSLTNVRLARPSTSISVGRTTGVRNCRGVGAARRCCQEVLPADLHHTVSWSNILSETVWLRGHGSNL